MGDQKEEELTIADEAVLNKYKIAGDIVNLALKAVVAMCVEGASVRDVCIHGDKLITEGTSKCFTKDKKMKRGIAFPTCVSINNCINHFSPLLSDQDATIKEGDVVKIDMGAHVDGFISVVGHTLVAGATKENKVTGRKADAVLAAYYSSQAALRLVRPGNENFTVTDTINKVASEYKCKPIEGMLSFQLQQNRIDGEKTIILNPNDAQRKEVEKVTFEQHEVYAVDVLVSTGEGHAKEHDVRVTIFRKTDETYSLKMKASKEFLSLVNKNHKEMPFNLRHFEDEKKARLGVLECVNHKLIDPYPVLWERPKEIVAQFKYTVLLLPSGPKEVTGLPLDLELYESEHKVEDADLVKLLATAVKPSSKSKKKKNAKANKENSTPAAPKEDSTPAATKAEEAKAE